MANKFQLKRTAVSGRTPNTTNSSNTSFIDAGELAVNLTDKKVYSSNGSATFEVGANLSTLSVTGQSFYKGSSYYENSLIQLDHTSSGMRTIVDPTSGLFVSNPNVAFAEIASYYIEIANNTTGSVRLYPNGQINSSGTANVKALTANDSTIANLSITTSATLNNGINLNFKDLSGNTAYFKLQNDNNFVFYNTNTAGGARAIWASFANSTTSTLQTLVGLEPQGGIYANGSLGTAGQVLTSNGSATYWSAAGGSGKSAGDGLGSNSTHYYVNTGYSFTWSNTHTFSANVSFGNSISINSGNSTASGGLLYFAGLADANWKMGRNTNGTTKWYYSNNTLDILAANSNLEGIVLGNSLAGGASYLETGHAGTYIKSKVTIGDASANSTINATSFSGTANNSTYAYGKTEVNLNVNSAGTATIANNASYLGGTAAASYQLNSTLAANVATMTANNATYAYGKTEGNLNVNSATTAATANNSTYAYGKTEINLNVNNATTAATANNSTYAYGKTEGNLNVNSATTAATANNSTNLNGQAASYYTNATNISTGTLAAARLPVLYLGTTTIQSTSAAQAVTGITTLAAGNTTITGFVNATSSVNASSFTVGTSYTANSVGVYGFRLYARSGTDGQMLLDSDLAEFGAQGRTVAGPVYVQFYTAAGASFPSVRMQAIGGNNDIGSGQLTINAANVSISGTLLEVSSAQVNAASFTVGTAYVANSTQLTLASAYKISANGSVGTAGQVLTSNASAVYWSTPTTGTVTSVASGNGLTGGPITSTGTLSVVANSGLVSNATGVFVIANSGLISNSTGVFVNANTELSANSTGVFHIDIARTNTTTGNTSPNYGGTFTAIDSITTNARGHVTAVNTKTVTMPSSNNTTYDLLPVANTTTNQGTLRLKDSANANDDVTFVGSGTTTLSSNATHIIVNSADQFVGTVTSVTGGSGLTGSITTSGSLAVGAGVGITVNADDVAVNANSGIVANTTGVFVNSSYIATLSANNADYLDGQHGAYYTNATNISTGTLPEAQLPYRMNQNVRTTDAVTFASLTLNGNLVVGGTTTTVSAQNLSVTDNMIYMNNGVDATITNLTANGSAIVFTANNNFQAGWDVEVTGVNPSAYNTTYSNITAANSTTFTVASTTTGAYVSGGTARGKTDTNPDIGFAGGYNDGTYRHAGFFRDATDDYFKPFKNYTPEPDASPFIDTANNTFAIAGIHASDLRIGNTSVYAAINSTSYSGSANNTTYLNGQLASYYTNATNITTGTLPYAQIPANIVNTSSAFTLSGVITHSANVVLGSSGLSANGGFGTAGHVLHSNGTATYWAADDQGVTSVATGNGMTGGTITSTGTVSILANTGIVANSTGAFVNSAYIATISANNTTYVNGKTEGNLNVNAAAQLTTARTIGDVSFNGTANIVPERITFKDTRSTNFNPLTYAGVTYHLKTNTTDSLADGGTYHGILNLNKWTDLSGGNEHQLAFTDNNNVYVRQSSNTTAWGSWGRLYREGTVLTPGANVAMANNTLDSPTMKAYKESVNTSSISTNTTLDFSTTNIYNLTLGGNLTLTFSNPPASGTLYSVMMIVKQDATGSRVITWPTSVKWPNASAPTLSTAANAVDVLNFFTVDGGTTYYGALSLANLS